MIVCSCQEQERLSVQVQKNIFHGSGVVELIFCSDQLYFSFITFVLSDGVFHIVTPYPCEFLLPWPQYVAFSALSTTTSHIAEPHVIHFNIKAAFIHSQIKTL